MRNNLVSSDKNEERDSRSTSFLSQRTRGGVSLVKKRRLKITLELQT